MIRFESLKENFQFLVIEVRNHIYNAFDYLNSPDPELRDRIVTRDDYIDNLKNLIENDCFLKTLSASGQLSKDEINMIRAMHTIAINLERIADFCVNIVGQVDYLTDYKLFYSFDYEEMLTEISEATAEIVPALKGRDLSKTLSVCRSENNLDRMYKRHFDRILSALKAGTEEAGDYVTILFIFRYLERIGDSLLNVGEAVLFAIIGERIKINQFQALQYTLSQSGISESAADVDLQFIWGTHSGCSIGRVENKKESQHRSRESIFKEGLRSKIQEERQGLELWQGTFPALVPRIFSYHEEEDEDKASLLLEMLPGCTLDEIVVTADQDTLSNALFMLEETLDDIWRETFTADGGPARETNYIHQLKNRMNAVHRVHPRFRRTQQLIGSSRVDSTRDLLEKCERIEQELGSPFKVLIHGDFNLNNIVYNHTDQRIYYIDLHRSRYYDFVQDVSVFLVSNFRLPVFDTGLRNRLNSIIERFFHFASGFAREKGDETFPPRLCLALARSFYTSTRFELDHAFAKEMFLRAHYLLDRVVEHSDKPWRDFRFPEQALYY
jgi:phosphate uptake regulator